MAATSDWILENFMKYKQFRFKNVQIKIKNPICHTSISTNGILTNEESLFTKIFAKFDASADFGYAGCLGDWENLFECDKTEWRSDRFIDLFQSFDREALNNMGGPMYLPSVKMYREHATIADPDVVSLGLGNGKIFYFSFPISDMLWRPTSEFKTWGRNGDGTPGQIANMAFNKHFVPRADCYYGYVGDDMGTFHYELNQDATSKKVGSDLYLLNNVMCMNAGAGGKGVDSIVALNGRFCNLNNVDLGGYGNRLQSQRIYKSPNPIPSLWLTLTGETNLNYNTNGQANTEFEVEFELSYVVEFSGLFASCNRIISNVPNPATTVWEIGNFYPGNSFFTCRGQTKAGSILGSIQLMLITNCAIMLLISRCMIVLAWIEKERLDLQIKILESLELAVMLMLLQFLCLLVLTQMMTMHENE